MSVGCRLGRTDLAECNHDVVSFATKDQILHELGDILLSCKRPWTRFRITILMSPNNKNYNSTFPTLYHFHSCLSIVKDSYSSVRPDSLTWTIVETVNLSICHADVRVPLWSFGPRFVCSCLFAMGGAQAAEEARLVTKIDLAWEDGCFASSHSAVMSRPVSPGIYKKLYIYKSYIYTYIYTYTYTYI
jgi:hypothetical protein